MAGLPYFATLIGLQLDSEIVLGVFLTRRNAPLVPGFQEATLSCNRNLADELSRALDF